MLPHPALPPRVPTPQPRLAAGAPLRWLRAGWQGYRHTAAASSLATALPAALGGLLVAAVLAGGRAPLLLALAGGFPLVAPCLLPGFARLAERQASGRPARLADFFAAWRTAPAGFWVLAGLAVFLSMIWFTDAAIQYGLFFGSGRWSPADGFDARLGGYAAFAGLTGGGLALAAWLVNGFAMPLTCRRGLALTPAVAAGLRALRAHPGVLALWAGVLGGGSLATFALCYPALVVTVPVLAYGSLAACEEIFPGSGT